MSKDDENEFVKRVSATLDEQADSLDGETLSKLNQARQAAIEKAGKRSSSWLFPASGIATAAGIAALSFSLWTNTVTISNLEPDVLEDIELLSSNEELDFYNDLAFYQWLEDEAQSG